MLDVCLLIVEAYRTQIRGVEIDDFGVEKVTRETHVQRFSILNLKG